MISGDGLGRSLGGLEGSLGASERCLRDPWGALGGPRRGPRASLEVSLGTLGGALGTLGGSLGDLGGSLGGP